jgi:hypothetical protein
MHRLFDSLILSDYRTKYQATFSSPCLAMENNNTLNALPPNDDTEAWRDVLLGYYRVNAPR